MPVRAVSRPTRGSRAAAVISRRRYGFIVSALFVAAAMGWFFLWDPVVHHESVWSTPGDIWLTFQVAGRVAHGHLGTIYVRDPDNFLTFPGIVFILTPLAALTSALHLSADTAGPVHIFVRPGAWLLLAPFIVVLSTIPLLASDAVAERIGIDPIRRVLLGIGGVAVLWGPVVVWGHPEDVVALGLTLYAILLGFDGRWNGAAWLLGVAVAVQPLVIVALPLLLVMAGLSRARGLLARAVLPPALVLIGPLVANFHLTVKTLFEQPGYPVADQTTPWTSLAPRLFGRGLGLAVAAGPGRALLLVLACVLAWWARRWRDRPEMLVWALALVLALRPLTESVMLSYYLYPALAVGVLCATRSVSWRFALAIAVAVFVTISSQWHSLPWATWWILNEAGMVVVVLCGIQPEPVRIAAPSVKQPRPTNKVESRLQSNRGRGAARRKQTRKGTGRKR
jgi:hypothetical protein